MTGDRFPEALGPAVARVRDADGTAVGTGFLLAPGLVATCAHVVAQALRVDGRDATVPTASLTVEFPLQRGGTVHRASVSAWRPVTADGSGDVALLRLLPGEGRSSGEPSGELSGKPSGEVSGEPSGEVPGEPRGELSGKLSREPSGEPSAELSGEPSAQPSAEPFGGPVPLAGVGDVWDHRFRILAFPAAAEHGAWIGGRLRGAVGHGWISMEAEGTAHRITPGCSGAPVWDEEVGAVVGMTVAADRGPAAVTSYLIPAATLLDLQPGLRRCPYRGLDAFREEDAEHFFGREEETDRLVDAVERHLVVPVVGPSGSGKTSLVRAGVLPRLRADGHTVSEIRPLPGTRASLTLARALAPLLARDSGVPEQERAALALAEVLDAEGAGAAAALGRRVLESCGPAGHVFFLNQLEETVAAEPATARTLLGLTIALAAAPAEGRRLRVLATLRSASLDDLVEPATARVLSDCAQVVAPLDRAALLRAVEGPAARVPGLTLEPGLAERIVDDAEGEPGHLPMVEFALTELWSHEKGIRLTHTGYEALGGVAGALSAHAEQRVGEVIAEYGEAPVRRLFTQLARPDDAAGFTRKPVRLSPLPPELRATAEALATRTRFVRITHGPDGDPLVDLAHEELVRAWPRLRTWLEASRDFRAWQERLLQSLAHWQETGRETGALLRGTMLATSLEQLASLEHRDDITQPERDFIEAGRRHQQRGLRRWRLAVAVLVVLALLAGGLAVAAWDRGTRLESRGRVIAARALAEEAGRLASTRPLMSQHLAMAAWHNHEGKEARQALLDAYLRGAAVIRGHAGPADEDIGSLDTTADGSTVVTLSSAQANERRVRVWTGLLQGRPRSWRVFDQPGVADAVELSDDGRLLAVATEDGSTTLHDLRRRKRLWTRVTERRNTTALDFSDSGGRLLRVADDFSEDRGRGWTVDVWDTADGRPVPVDAKGETPVDAALVGDGTAAVQMIESDDSSTGTATVHDLSTGRVLRTFRSAESLAGRGKGVVVDGGLGRYTFHSLTGPDATGPPVVAMRMGGVDATGRYVVQGAEDPALWVTDLRTGARYGAPVWTGALEWAQRPAVVPGPGGAPCVLTAVGSDLLVLRTTPEHRKPLLRPDTDGAYSFGAYARSADGVHHARSMGTDEDGETSNTWLTVARVGAELSAEPMVMAEWDATAAGPPEVFFTADSRHLVLWYDRHDMLSVRTADQGAHEHTVPVTSTIGFAAPLYGSRIVILTEDELILYDAASGTRRVVENRPCGVGPCAGFAVRPSHPHEVVIADSGGRIAVRNVDTGVKTPTSLLTMATDAVSLGLTVAPQGELIAVPLDSRTIARRELTDGDLVGQTIESSEDIQVMALADDGTLLSGTVGPDEFMDVWRPQDVDEPYVTIPLDAASEDLRLTGDRLDVRDENGDLAIPLDPDTWQAALCRHWPGTYTKAEKAVLKHEGAVTDSPCP
ncbi:trypsin-like peptidase domain-containing protein [Streptomyces sp. NPDC096205]|uniref:nSTAND1 domain-containing NTPase n=1 Tax=Streptomyces sp. NPDC096205 TaxID=3366081 RepID=UPI00382FF4E2